ncbi:MAG: ribosomal protein S18-alanine N-acetyltransferase [Actinomycetia bacterium]|nr:ribosomal protein S18-alanine N-acetyltransferase [Actinomycetes bacterium]
MNVTRTDRLLRRMRWWDIDAVHALEERVFAETAWSRETFWSELAGVPQTRHYVVVASGEPIVGYAGLMAIGPDADVQTLAVASDYQRQGVGAQLLDSLIDEAKLRCCSRLTLEVAAASEPARRLYLRRGFEVIARRSGYYGPGADALIMRLRVRSEPEESAP